ncbi:MAG: phage holin family protein [Dermatophilaceae bacterium]
MVSDFLANTLVGGLALWLASFVVPGITFGHSGDTMSTFLNVLLVAAVFGAVNTLIKPVLRFFGAPLVWVTLGLFAWVINAWMLLLTSWLSAQLGLAFHVSGFWWSAVWGALVITIVSMVIGAVLPRRDRVYG